MLLSEVSASLSLSVPAVKKLLGFHWFPLTMVDFVVCVFLTASRGKERPQCCEHGTYVEEVRIQDGVTYEWIRGPPQHHECLTAGE